MNDTHIFVLTNSLDVTSDYLCQRFEKEGVLFARFDTDMDCKRATIEYQSKIPVLKWSRYSLTPEQISTVVLRRPKPIEVLELSDKYSELHTAREWSEVLEGFLAHIDEKRWINHPSRNSRASHKIEQLSRAEIHGLKTPMTLVTNIPAKAKEFLVSQKNGVIVKPLASGYIERERPEEDSLIYTHEFKTEHHKFLKEIQSCPVLFQEMVPKTIDVRVTILDGILIATALKATEDNGTQRLDIRRDNMADVKYSQIDMPKDVASGLKSLISSYGLRFSAVDFGVTETGEWIFFEINPNGQWAWLDLSGATDIGSMFVDQLEN